MLLPPIRERLAYYGVASLAHHIVSKTQGRTMARDEDRKATSMEASKWYEIAFASSLTFSHLLMGHVVAQRTVISAY